MKSQQVEGKCAETEVPGTKLCQRNWSLPKRSKVATQDPSFSKILLEEVTASTQSNRKSNQVQESFQRKNNLSSGYWDGGSDWPPTLTPPNSGKDRGGSMWTRGKEPQQLWPFYRVSALGVTQWDTQESAPIQLSQLSSHLWMYMGQWQGDRDIQGNLPCFCSLALGPAASVIVGQIGRRKNKSHRWSWWHSTRWFNI